MTKNYDHDPVRLRDAADTDGVLSRVLGAAERRLPSAARAEALAKAIEAAALREQASIHADSSWQGLAKLGLRLAGVGLAGVFVSWGAVTLWSGLHAGSGAPARGGAARQPQAPTSIGAPRQPAAREGAPTLPPTAASAGGPRSIAAGRVEPGAHGAAVTAASDVARGTPLVSGRDVGHAKNRSVAHALEPRAPRTALESSTSVATRRSESSPPRRTDVPSELQLLAAAQRALRGSPAEALELANLHEREYPSGVFAEEREEIAVEALLALGFAQAGNERGRAFLERYPKSAHAAAVVRLLRP